MIYAFKDTTEHHEVFTIPNEAMYINGDLIETQIQGYRTLTVSGRELFGNTVENYEVGNTPGAYYRRSKLPVRTIKVTYQLIADDSEDFRDKFNKLNEILNVEQPRLIFADEPDKYFIGTKSSAGDVPTGVNQITATFDIVCSDPFKYAVTEKSETAIVNEDGIPQITLDNAGSVPVSIDYEIESRAECGFYGVVGANGVMQYGYAEEEDTTQQAVPSETLINMKTGAQLASPTGTHLDHFNSNSSVMADQGLGGTSQPTTIAATLAASSASKYNGKNVLEMSNIGTGSGWVGGNRVYYFSPYTPEGAVSPVATFANFKIVAHAWLECAIKDVGYISISALDANDEPIVAMDLLKWQTDRTIGVMSCHIYKNGGRELYEPATFDLSVNGQASRKIKAQYGADMQIVKSGSKITFSCAYNKFSIDVPELESAAAKSMCIQIARRGSSVPSIMCVLDAYFMANNVTYEYDIPNRYQEGDVLNIIGSEARAYLNGTPCIDDEIIGTEYFKADPGENIIQFPYSSWCTAAPAISATWREAWL